MLKFKPATKRTFEKWRIRGRAGHTPSFREIWAIIADFCEKYKIFPKIFIIFTHFSNERNLSIAKGRSPIRARVRTQAGEIKTSESRHAVVRQKSGWLDSRATSWRGPNASCWSRTSHSDDAGIRARDPEGTQDSRVRRGGARGTPAARPPAEARVRVSELLRSPQRAEI